MAMKNLEDKSYVVHCSAEFFDSRSELTEILIVMKALIIVVCVSSYSKHAIYIIL